MAILKCDKCGCLREVSNQYLGKKVKCPACQQSTQIHDTVTFLTKALQKLTLLQTEINDLKQSTPPASTDTKVSPTTKPLNVFNTTAFTEADQYVPIVDWFKAKQIQVEVDEKAVDTTGYFDEIAVKLGDNYKVLKEVSDKIKRTQNKGYVKTTLNLSKHSQKEQGIIKDFCKALYEIAFITKYFDQKVEKRIMLSLQTAPQIVNFFNEEWLEWFVFMKLIVSFQEQGFSFSCLRSFTIQFPNQDKHEIDLFFLVNDSIPLLIECKSGEFRSFLQKYSILRRRLKIDKSHFLMLVLDTNSEQTQSLTSMFDLTVLNEKNFLSYVAHVLAG